jgi:protein-tyrosine phosphatase
MQPKIIAIEGTSNLREIGGYPTISGKKIRSGMIYRSEALVFPGVASRSARYSDEHKHAYRSLGLKTIVDLRGEREAAAMPSAWPYATGANLIALPMEAGGEGDATVIMKLLREGKIRSFDVEDVARFYSKMVRAQALTIGKAIGSLSSDGRLPALLHCAAGKDRTGIVIAMLLEMLGIPRDTVVADYAMTEVLRPNRVFEYRDVLDPLGVDLEAVRALFDAPAEAMKATLDGIDSEFGTVDRFLVNACAMSLEQLNRLRVSLLEPK